MATSTTGQAKSHKAYFSISTNIYFLFKDWNLNSAKGLLVAILLSSFLAILHEIIVYLLYLDQSLADRSNKRICRLKFLSLHIRRSILYLLHVGLAYVLMLCAMTYNIWVLLAVSLGAGLGYLLSRPVLQILFLKRLGSKTPTSGRSLSKMPRDHSNIPLVKHGAGVETSTNKTVFNSGTTSETPDDTEMVSPQCEINSMISLSLSSKRRPAQETFPLTSSDIELKPIRVMKVITVT